MSAGRLPWEPTGWTVTDEKTGRSLFVSGLGAQWSWSMYEKGAVTHALGGSAHSPSEAKGLAHKALETHPLPKPTAAASTVTPAPPPTSRKARHTARLAGGS